MQQRQPRLGDILDDYCPRERRLTNHAVVAMIGDAVKQTRCTTCESEHEYKHARVPRPRRKSEQAALYSQVLAAVTPKKVVPPSEPFEAPEPIAFHDDGDAEPEPVQAGMSADAQVPDDELADETPAQDDAPEPPLAPEEGFAHRRLIRAQLPRHEGQVVVARQAPDFTIRQPAPARPSRFRPRPPQQQQQQRGAQFHGNRSGGNPNANGNRAGGQRQNGRPQGQRQGNRQGHGRNRSK